MGIKGEPVAIGKLERFVGDWALAHSDEEVAPVIEKTAEGLNAITNGALLSGDANWSITTGWRLMFGSEAVPAGTSVS